MLGLERMNSGGQVAKACKDGGQRAGQLCSSLLSWESTGAHGLVKGVSTAANNGPNIYPICQLGGIMLRLPHRTVVMIN